MSTRTLHQITDNTWFVTFTNHDWIPLFQITDTYHLVYKWLKLINEKYSIKTLAFVIMPNHVHFLFQLKEGNANLNKVIGNGKRFMAYDIIKKLEESGSSELLSRLASAVTDKERAKGQLHKVFEASFDAKPIYTFKFLYQKLDYIHHNPVSGKWSLCDEFTDYPHSSAAFYEFGILHPQVEITDFKEYWVD
jgi:REP element-mobilizing transposase RayT